ncbi:NAD(P)H-binding protein [Actinomycetes bacterium KLBMP 9797]
MGTPPLLVLGATGTTGRRVAQLLRGAGFPVRAASRRGETRFDWSDPATWPPAVRGAAAMYLMAPHELPVDPAFVRCAVEHGVRRVVLLSSRSIEAMGDERLMAAERTVRDSGADWTIVRPDWFNQNFDEGFFRPAVRAGELAVPLGGVRQAFVDADDIAAVAVAALTEPGHAGRSYEVTGPRALSFGEAVGIISRAAGRPVRFRGGDEDYLAAQSAFGVPVEQIRRDIAAFAALRECGDAHPTDTVRRVTGRDPKSFEVYAAAVPARVWGDVVRRE